MKKIAVVLTTLAMAACLTALEQGEGVEEICRTMAQAVYAQYPAGAARAL